VKNSLVPADERENFDEIFISIYQKFLWWYEIEMEAAIRSDLGRLEKWADRNFTKLNKGKVSYLQWKNPMQKYRLWSILAGRTWRAWKTESWTWVSTVPSQPRRLVASWALRASQGSAPSPPCGAFETSSPKTFTQCMKSAIPPSWSGGWSMRCVRRGWRSWVDSSLKMRRLKGDFISVYS